jgi:hypothetical protein
LHNADNLSIERFPVIIRLVDIEMDKTLRHLRDQWPRRLHASPPFPQLQKH